ncbi:MAG: hypothetical protein ACU84H_06080 [Gammaproteobacteria bacterium]
MEEQRLIVQDEELVKRETACSFDRNRRINAIDSVGNFVNIRPGLAVGYGHQTPLALAGNSKIYCVQPIK